MDVSINGGRTWRQAEMEQASAAPWARAFWRLPTDLPGGEHENAARARGSAGPTQPTLPEETWKLKGYLSAARHRVRVRVG